LKCEVRMEDTPEDVAANVLKLEHRAYPEALRKVIEDGSR